MGTRRGVQKKKVNLVLKMLQSIIFIGNKLYKGEIDLGIEKATEVEK